MARQLRFKVQLQGIDPPMWRRFLLPEGASFDDLHEAIQDSCGWEDCHQFTFLDSGSERRELPAMRGGWEGTPLDSWFGERKSCIYWYDFGDDWMHEVTLEGVEEHPGGGGRQLLDGARAFPPEDCGGLPGYLQCVDTRRSGGDPELLEWLGDWDPERFDLEAEQRRFGGQPSLQPVAAQRKAEGPIITVAPLPGSPGRAKQCSWEDLEDHLRQIVRAGSAHAPGKSVTTGLTCHRRPKRKKCKGRMAVTRSDSGDEVEWRCTKCTDGGLLAGWRGGWFDLSDEAAAHASGGKDEIAVRIPADAYAALLGGGAAPGRLLYSAQASAGQVVLRGDTEELEALLEQATFDANHATSPKLQERLDVVCEAIRAELGGEHAIFSEEETETFEGAVRGLPLMKEERDALWNMYTQSWGLFSGAAGAAEGMESVLRELAERTVLERKIRQAFAYELVDRHQFPFFLAFLGCTRERIVEFGGRDPENGLELCRGFLAGIGGIAERVQGAEVELAKFAAYVTQDGLAMAGVQEEATQALYDLLGDLLDLWSRDPIGTFCFTPELIIGLALDQRDRRWVREQLQERLDQLDLDSPEEWEELKDRLE